MSVNLVSNEHEKYILGNFFHQNDFLSTKFLFIISFVPYDYGPYKRGVQFNL